MQKKWVWFLLVVVFMVSTTAAQASETFLFKSGKSSDYLPGSLVVVYKKANIDVGVLADNINLAIKPTAISSRYNLNSQRLASFLSKHKLSVDQKRMLKSINGVVLKYNPKTQNVNSIIGNLKKDSNVASVSLNYIFSPNAVSYKTIKPKFGIATFKPQVFTANTNSKVVVGVIDSGLAYNHELFSGRLWDGLMASGQNCLDSDGQAVSGGCSRYGFSNFLNFMNANEKSIDPAANKAMPALDNRYTNESMLLAVKSHGSHAAGIVVNQSKDGQCEGTSWDESKIMVAGLQNDLSLANILAAFNFATLNGFKVINASFGTTSNIPSLNDAVKSFVAQGGLVVTSAGNDNANLDVTPQYPCNTDSAGVICVGSIGDNPQTGKSYFSNYSSKSVDVTAPGEYINSAGISSLSENGQNNTYVQMSGTSMSSPYVAGEVAVLFSLFPNLTNLQIKELLLQSATSYNELKTVVTNGAVANLCGAIDMATGGKPVCGDGQITGDEVCDGKLLNSQTCTTQGFDKGNLACESDCLAYDFSDCSNNNEEICGDNIKNGNEICDGDDLDGKKCLDLGFDQGVLGCLSTCEAYDTSKCTKIDLTYCGDGQKNGQEACDGNDFGGMTCKNFGMDKGTLACSPTCESIDSSDCSNEIVEVLPIEVDKPLSGYPVLKDVFKNQDETLTSLTKDYQINDDRESDISMLVDKVIFGYGADGNLPFSSSPMIGKCAWVKSGANCYVYSFLTGGKWDARTYACSDTVQGRQSMTAAIEAGACAQAGLECGKSILANPLFSGMSEIFTAQDTLESVAGNDAKMKAIVDKIFNVFGGQSTDTPNTYTPIVGQCTTMQHYNTGYCYVYSYLKKGKVSKFTDSLCGVPNNPADDNQMQLQKDELIKAVRNNNCCVAKVAGLKIKRAK